MKIEIEVDIPVGYEFVRFGKPKTDEQYLYCGIIYLADCCKPFEVVIIRKSWVRPGWMKDGWIAKDMCESWCWYGTIPKKSSNYWHLDSDSSGGYINLKYVNWNPPEHLNYVNWEESLIKV